MQLPANHTESTTRSGRGSGCRTSVVIVPVRPGVQRRLPVLFPLRDVVDAGVRVGGLQDPEVQVVETGFAVGESTRDGFRPVGACGVGI